MSDLELVLNGAEAESAIAELAAALGEPDLQLTPRRLPNPAAEAGQKAIDPVAVAALLLSIPGAVLAVVDLTDRIAKRRRAKALIEAAGRMRSERRVEIVALTPDGPKALAELDADGLLALVERKGEAPNR